MEKIISRNKPFVNMIVSSSNVRGVLKPHTIACINLVEGVGISVGASAPNISGGAAE